MAYLPDDILYMICAQLWHQQDFNTLFNCACSGKQLATVALTNLYRMHDVAPVISGGSDEELPHDKSCRMSYAIKMSQEERIVMKWAGLWRTIILSSLGKTLYPYSQYIRTLNLQDLEELLTDSKFKAGTVEDFFQGDLAQFRVDKGAEIRGRSRLDAVEIINRVGEAITKQTPLLEELTGKVSSEALSRWIPRLPRLTHLKPWHGVAVEGNGNLIRLHCPLFKGLDFWKWDDSNANDGLAAFLNELRPHSLQSFETFSHPHVPATLQALSGHGESLVNLNLNFISMGTLPTLSLLKGCTNLVSLSLAGIGYDDTDLEESYKYAYLEIINWLKECKKLRILAFSKLFSAPSLMAPILLEESIHLTSLEYESYDFPDSKKFHQALANQTSLQSLWLKGDTDEGDVSDTLVESLSNLVNLTDLRLREVSDTFSDRHILQLANSLPKLEVWSTSGYGLTDAILGAVASLRSLRRLDIGALTSFTADGILGFVERLGPGNKGLILAVMNADMDSELSGPEQELIQERIARKVEGRFEFTLSRDPDGVSSFEGDSD
ncbi:hypothetical protein MMC22_007201 [Lobaria immixta]|nr:hypothetical protein [Lobaria immixta]